MVPSTSISAARSILSATTKFPSATFNAVCPLVPVIIKASSLASQVRLSPDVPLYNTTSWPEPSVPTVRVASNCTATSISTTSKFVVPSTSMLPLILTDSEEFVVMISSIPAFPFESKEIAELLLSIKSISVAWVPKSTSPFTSTVAALISKVVVAISTSVLASISNWPSADEWTFKSESLNCNWLATFNNKPVSAICVRVTSWSFPKFTTAPSAKNKSENSAVLVPK